VDGRMDDDAFGEQMKNIGEQKQARRREGRGFLILFSEAVGHPSLRCIALV
jgi:hypothetical protein